MTDERSIYIKDEKLFVRRISPMMFLFDPTVTLSNLDEARWIARAFDVSLKDLREDDELTVEKSLKGRHGFGTLLGQGRAPASGNGGYDVVTPTANRAKTLLDLTEPDFQKSEASRFVRVYEIFRRPSPKEAREGSRGHVILYTTEQEKPLRSKPWPYKAEGWPAKVLMFNEVPDSVFGLSDLEVFGNIVDHKNMVVNLQLRNAQENSKVIVAYDKTGMDEETVQKVEDGEQNIIGMDGDPRTKIFVASPGGTASSELYLLDTRIQANLDEKSGVTDLKKGFLRSGEESAESVRIRNAGASARPAYRQDIMADFLRDSIHFILQLTKQFVPVTEAVRIVGSLDIEWSDNPTKEEIQADTDVELDVISMLPENPEKEIQELTTILNLMREAIADPALARKIAEEGKTFNISPIIENLLLRLRIRNPDVFRTIRPEESMGFASVAELKAAQANVEAALTGATPPSPPEPGQDHRARLDIYTAVQKIFALEGRVSEILEQLILVQAQLAEQEAKQNSPREGERISLKPPKVEALGSTA